MSVRWRLLSGALPCLFAWLAADSAFAHDDLGPPAADARRGARWLPQPVDPGVRTRDYAGSFTSAPVPHWSRRLPGGVVKSASHSERTRPAVLGGSLFVGSAGDKAVFQLARANGTLERRFAASASVESEPVIADGRLYFSDTAGMTWCYALTGEFIWKHQSNAPVLVRPTLDGDRLLITNVDDLAFALDRTTGELVWRYQNQRDLMRAAELALYAAPPAVVVGDVAIVGFSDGRIVGVDRMTGEERWGRRIGEGRYPDVVAEPVALGDDLFVSGYFQPLVALDVASNTVRWRLDVGAAAPVAVVAIDGAPAVLHPGTDGTLRALSVLTGAERWRWDSGDTAALTGVVDTPAGVLVTTAGGQVVMLDLDNGLPVWRYDAGKLLVGVSAAPVVDGRQLLLVTNGANIISLLSPRGRANGDAPWSRYPFDQPPRANQPQ